jgi:hypothetical protein
LTCTLAKLPLRRIDDKVQSLPRRTRADLPRRVPLVR